MGLAIKIDPTDQPVEGGPSTARQFPQVQPRVREAAGAIADRSATVARLPKQPQLPRWLTILVRCQQGSTVLTGGLVASVLIVYSWTVYVDTMVAKTFRKLDTLQTQTQQLTTANETLKQSMAEQATDVGLRPYQPNQAIFLAPAAADAPAPETPSRPPERMPYPLGY